MSATLMVVGCGFPQLGLIRFARAEGLTVVGVDASATAVGRDLCDHFVHCSTTDVDGIVAGARAHAVDGITTGGSEHALQGTAVAAPRLGLPFYGDPDTVRRCQAKDEMRAAFDAAGVPSPAHHVVRTVDEARAFAEAHGLPIVVKPPRGWGQRGVSVCYEPAELVQAVAAATDAARHVGAEGCLLEDFIEGREFSVDAYTHDGTTEVLAITERIITGYPEPPGITFAEVFPAEVTPVEEAQLVAVAGQGLAALGITRGPSYTQMRLGPAGAFIVETAFRLGGGLDPDVAYLASGISLYRRLCGLALGRDTWARAGVEGKAHGGAIGKFIVGTPGRVRSVSGVARARGREGVVTAEVYVGVGDEVLPLTDGSKRAGHVLAYGASRAEAEARAITAASDITIETEATR
ncbi:MAG: ATP-grasp domain-containing protein [Myxococcota bacterium]